MAEQNKVSDEEFNLVLRLTHETKLDGVIDITYNDHEDYFWDFENDCAINLQEGFEILADSMAYKFQEEGFTDKESAILEKLFQRFVPDFVN